MKTDSAIIFDMDGVLLDTPKIHREVWRDFASTAPWPAVRHYRALSAGRRSRDVLEELIGDEVPDQQIEDIVASLHRDFLRRCRGSDLVFPAMRRTVEQLRGTIPLALATSAPRHVAREMLDDLFPSFDAVITSDECATGKPDPEVYGRARTALGKGTSPVLAVEDTAIGVQAAVAAGCTAWALALNPVSASAVITAGASVVAVSVAELADLIVSFAERSAQLPLAKYSRA
ncbi:HAD family hydrolase [Arthrobacter sulfonylureivorans]|uniref:HAD family hydrolase n=1 Tax=Arthrobacter sulfonylureivorans TaxID=2486855 RepID=UPI0039E6EE83